MAALIFTKTTRHFVVLGTLHVYICLQAAASSIEQANFNHVNLIAMKLKLFSLQANLIPLD